MSQRKKRDATPTRVALVCLKTTQNNSQINNQSLLKIFAKHGSISKILIFERGQLLTKVFIEYDEVESAIEAIKSLNNTKILNQISCNVYHSRLKQLKLDTVPYTKGIDFTNPPQNSTDQDLKMLNEWQDFQFESHSTDELTDEEEPQFSEEKMKDIITKLNLIDDEINLTIETKIGTALDKLHQNTMCIKVRVGQNILCNFSHVVNLFCLFGQITYIKSSDAFVYVKFSSNQECQKAYELLKEYVEMQIIYNFETINGQLISPECQCSQANFISKQLLVSEQQVLQEISLPYSIVKSQQIIISFTSVIECLMAIARMKSSNLQFLSFTN